MKTKKKLEEQQQGDLTFYPVESVPKGCTRVKPKPKGYVLSEGSNQGHAHLIAQEIELFEKEGILYLQAEKSVKVTHEEHKPLTLGAGIWAVGRILEFDYIQEMHRRVVD